jgi:hypothetical protein
MSKAITAKAAIELLSRKSVRTKNSVNLYADVAGERYPLIGFVLDDNDGVFTTEANDIDPADDEKLFQGSFEGTTP